MTDGEVMDFRPAASSAKGCLDAGQLREVAQLASAVEAHYGGVPQDIEWSFGEGTCFLLQARPISTLKQEPAPA